MMLGCGLFASSCNKHEQGEEANQKGRPESKPGVITLTDECDGGDDEDPIPILFGVVSDASSHTPIAHACISVYTNPGGSLVNATGTDANGHYYVNTLSNGTYNLIVSAGGYTTQTIPFTISGSPRNIDVGL